MFGYTRVSSLSPSQEPRGGEGGLLVSLPQRRKNEGTQVKHFAPSPWACRQPTPGPDAVWSGDSRIGLRKGCLGSQTALPGGGTFPKASRRRGAGSEGGPGRPDLKVLQSEDSLTDHTPLHLPPSCAHPARCWRVQEGVGPWLPLPMPGLSSCPMGGTPGVTGITGSSRVMRCRHALLTFVSANYADPMLRVLMPVPGTAVGIESVLGEV